MNVLKNLTVIAFAALITSGCGGGGGGSTATPNGIYTGSITGGRGAPINGGEKGIIYNNRMMIFSSDNGIRQMFESQITQSGTNLSGSIIYYPANSAATSSSLTLTGSFIENT